MATPKFITVKSAFSTAEKPLYIGIVQHDRTMSAQETYAWLAAKLGYTVTQIRATNKALAKVLRAHADKGNITVIDGVASVRHVVKGSFEGSNGPWVKGKNMLLLTAYEHDPFKSALSGVTPENMTGGANPRIDSVLEETTGEYDELRRDISIAVLDQLRDIQASPDGTELSFLNYVNSSSRPDGEWWGKDVLLTVTIGGIPTTRWIKFCD